MLIDDLHTKPQFVTNNDGKKVAVLLPIKDYKKILEELEELQDIRAYDAAKKNDDGSRILFSDYLKKRKLKNA
jgi:PHD/YefM family antitoxin component YafN of YafNO toxin-antitoxin module